MRTGLRRAHTGVRWSASLLLALGLVSLSASLTGCRIDFRPLGPPKWDAEATSIGGVSDPDPEQEKEDPELDDPALPGEAEAEQPPEEMEIFPEIPLATLQIDGRRSGDLEKAPIPYYGVIEVDSVPTRPIDSFDAVATRTRYVIDEPVTPWIFPFDFFAELVVVAFSGDPERAVAVPLSEPETTSRDRDATIDAITSRARLARTER